jgi:ABC-type branched-subunit amino acid transport system ATPase component
MDTDASDTADANVGGDGGRAGRDATEAGRESEDRPALLEVDGVVKRFGGLVAVGGATFEVETGSIVGLIGPNGAGKSTLFDCITGVYTPEEGEIRLHGDPIQGLSSNAIAQRGVGRTFQTPKTFRGMTVRENLAFAGRDQTGERALGAFVWPGTVRREENELQDTVEETLAFLELDHLADEYASALSGGQRKLLELGRVLMMDPEIILLDEPVAGVNPALTDDLLDRLHDLNDSGRTILFIEHDMDIVMDHCDDVVVLHNGETLAVGPPGIVQEDERVVEAYLGGYD